MNQKYSPGLHLLTEINVPIVDKLTASSPLQKFWDDCILENDLNKISDIYHEFENGGFTALVCLTESHFSIHTWPEYNRANIDIYLSNFSKRNNEKVISIMEQTIKLFGGTIIKQYELER